MRPEYDDAVTHDLRRWFDRYGSLSFDNFPVAGMSGRAEER